MTYTIPSSLTLPLLSLCAAALTGPGAALARGEAPVAQAEVSFYNLSDLASIEVWTADVDGRLAPLTGELGWGQALEPARLPAGPQKLFVFASPASGNPDDALAVVQAILPKEAEAQVALFGAAAEGLDALVIADAAPPEGSFTLAVWNIDPALGAVDLWLEIDGRHPTPLAEAVSFGEGDHALLPSGSDAALWVDSDRDGALDHRVALGPDEGRGHINAFLAPTDFGTIVVKDPGKGKGQGTFGQSLLYTTPADIYNVVDGGPLDLWVSGGVSGLIKVASNLPYGVQAGTSLVAKGTASYYLFNAGDTPSTSQAVAGPIQATTVPGGNVIAIHGDAPDLHLSVQLPFGSPWLGYQYGRFWNLPWTSTDHMQIIGKRPGAPAFPFTGVMPWGSSDGCSIANGYDWEFYATQLGGHVDRFDPPIFANNLSYEAFYANDANGDGVMFINNVAPGQPMLKLLPF